MGLIADFTTQFKSGTGVSLRNAIDELTKTVAANRKELARLTQALDRLEQKLAENSATGIRIETHAQAVADDLIAAHMRADNTEGVPGEAADSFSRTPTE